MEIILCVGSSPTFGTSGDRLGRRWPRPHSRPALYTATAGKIRFKKELNGIWKSVQLWELTLDEAALVTCQNHPEDKIAFFTSDEARLLRL